MLGELTDIGLADDNLAIAVNGGNVGRSGSARRGPGGRREVTLGFEQRSEELVGQDARLTGLGRGDVTGAHGEVFAGGGLRLGLDVGQEVLALKLGHGDRGRGLGHVRGCGLGHGVI